MTPAQATPSPGVIPVPDASKRTRRVLAGLAYLGPLVLVPLFVRKKDRFLAYHTRQGLYLFATAATLLVLMLFILYAFWTPALDLPQVFRVLSVIWGLAFLGYVALSLFLAVQSVRGRMTMLPLLGDLAGEN